MPQDLAESSADLTALRRHGRARGSLPVTHAGDDYSVGPSSSEVNLAMGVAGWHRLSLGAERQIRRLA